jgi:HK97 family phage portal protein
MKSITAKIRDAVKNRKTKAIVKRHNPLIPANASVTSVERVPLIQQVSVGTSQDRNAPYSAKGSEVSYQEVSVAYKNYWLLKRALGVRAANIAPRQIRVIDINPRTKRHVVKNHPLTKAFDYPNESMSNMWFNASYEIDSVLAGEWFVEIKEFEDGKIELWRRRPDEVVKVDIKNRGEQGGNGEFNNRPIVTEYKVQTKLGSKSTEPVSVLPENMIHVRQVNPTNLFRGTGDVQSILSLIYSDANIQSWINTLIENNAVPGYAVIVDDPRTLRPGEREEYIDKLKRDYGGIAKAGEPIILATNQDIKTISYKPTELNFIPLSEMNQDSISTALGVPNELLGTGNNTYDNFENAMRYLWGFTLQPQIKYRDNYLTQFFRNRGDLTQFQVIETDISSVVFLQEDEDKRIEKALKLLQFGAWSGNQIAKFTNLNLPLNQQGNVIYVPSNLVQVAEEPFEPMTRYWRQPSGKSLSKTVKKQLPADTPDIVQDYEDDILDLIEQANDGEIDEDEFKEALTDIVIAFVLAAFLDGSGLSQDQLGEEELQAITEEAEQALLGVENLAEDVFSGRLGGGNESQLDTLARVGLWAGVGLSVYNLGLLFDPSDPFIKWVIDPAKDNCSTCLAQNGKVLRASEWRQLGLWPQGRMLECKGYNCGCRPVKQ